MTTPPTGSAHALTPKSELIAQLDGIRALAICMVLVSHLVIYENYLGLRPIGLEFGQAGVSLFFVLSGYLITRLLLREEDSRGRVSLKYFYIRRALRLFPALLLYLSVVFALWLCGLLPHHPWHSFASSILYVRNIWGRGHETDHLWSLSVEEHFYLLWPVAMLALPRRGARRLCLALTGIGAVLTWRVTALRAGLADEGQTSIRRDFRFDAPLLGCAIALGEHHWARAFRWFSASSVRRDIVFVSGTAILLGWFALHAQGHGLGGVDSTLVALLGGVLLCSQIGVAAPGVTTRFLATPPMVFVGRISYGV